MKYSENFSNKKRKMSSYFYVVVACCLLIIGGASWFAVSNFNADSEPESSKQEEYTDKTPSYTESETPKTESAPAEDVAEPVKDEPYSSEETTQEEPAPKVFSMPVEGEIIKDYSQTNLQYSATYGDMRLHTGIDIACENGTAVSACANGKVLSVEESANFGTVVTIDHYDGITAKYSALTDIKIKAGDSVQVGDVIAVSDTVPAECNDKAHIHIEVFKDGTAVSPLETLGLN